MAISFDYLNTIQKLNDPLLSDSFAWEINGRAHWIWRYLEKDMVVEAKINPINNAQFTVVIDNEEYPITAKIQDDILRVETQGQQHQVTFVNNVAHITFYSEHGACVVERFNWNKLNSQDSSHTGQLTAPMPATVVAILKNRGDAVKAGERLIILEAMKMEHTIHAPIDGILLEIFYEIGAQVNEGAELLSLSEPT